MKNRNEKIIKTKQEMVDEYRKKLTEKYKVTCNLLKKEYRLQAIRVDDENNGIIHVYCRFDIDNEKTKKWLNRKNEHRNTSMFDYDTIKGVLRINQFKRKID